jgi:pilus assembly protein CpaB
VVKTAIPAGTPVNDMAASLVIEKMPAAGKSDTALSTLDNKTGTVAAVDLVPGEQLLAERLVAPADVKAQGAVEVPAGFQEVSFQLEPKRVVGGRINVGDHVGISLELRGGCLQGRRGDATTQLTLRKVLVTAVQRAPQAASAEKPRMGRTPRTPRSPRAPS